MSTNSNKPNTSEEVDLGQLFKLIGNAFDRFFNFFITIFKSIFLAFVWLVFLVKKRIIILSSAVALGFLIGLFFTETSSPKYESSVTIVQNYPTGENLYNSVSYFNDLVRQGDHETLGSVLGIETQRAESILSFDVQPLVSDNDKLVAFNDYITKLDSLAASKIGYEDFLKNNEDYTHKHQQIIIKSTLRNSFKSVFSSIVESINLNPFFVNEQLKDIQELTQTKTALEFALVKSDSLQNTYKRVLERDLSANKGSEIGITFEGSSEVEKTKEFELYLSDLELRDKLIEIERDLLDKQYIVETISNKQDSGSASNTKNFFGLELPLNLYMGILFFLLTFAVLLALEFSRFIEKFRTQVSN